MITKIKAIRPMFNGIVTTCNKYPKNQAIAGTILVDTTKADSIKEYQTVVSVGPMVRGIEVGDTVFINPKRYAVKKHKEGTLKDGIITDNPTIGYNFTIVEINDIPHLYLQDSDVDYVAEIEEFEPEPIIYNPEKKIIL